MMLKLITRGSGLVKSVGVVRRLLAVSHNFSATALDLTGDGRFKAAPDWRFKVENTYPDAPSLGKRVGDESSLNFILRGVLFQTMIKPHMPNAGALNALRRIDAHFSRATTIGAEMLAIIQQVLQLPSEKRSSFVNANMEFYNEHQKMEWRTDIGFRTVKRGSGWWLIVDIKHMNEGLFLSLPPDVEVHNTGVQEYRYNRKDYMPLSKAMLGGTMKSVKTFMDSVIGGNGRTVHAYYSAKGSRLDIKCVDAQRKIKVQFHSYPGYPNDVLDWPDEED